MPSIRNWLAGLPPACLMNATAWIYHHPLTAEVLALVTLFALEVLR